MEDKRDEQITALDIALRICGYNFPPNLVAITWELTKAIHVKGLDLTVKEVIKIQTDIGKVEMKKEVL